MIKLAYIQNELKDQALGEGVMVNTLFLCNQMKMGKHHLYDDIDAEIEPDDLNDDEFN